MKNNRSGFLILLSGFFVFGCASPKYFYHTKYEVSGCKKLMTQQEVVNALVHDGYLHFAESKPHSDVFHRAKIIAKGPLASEAYEDVVGDFSVSVCSPKYVVSEETRSCLKSKDCTKEQQNDIQKSLERLGCQVQSKSSHSKAWALEDRQDWTTESCATLVEGLEF